MTEEMEVYAGQGYSDRAGSRRRYNLTNEDLEAITAIVEAVVYKQQHTDLNCRFAAIRPGDLKAMVDAHKKFTIMMDDNRTVVEICLSPYSNRSGRHHYLRILGKIH